jgi:hypothetical protein
MNWIRMRKKYIFIVFLTIVFPIIFLIFFELLFFAIYKITSSKYFENKIETNLRNETKETFEIFSYESTGNTKDNSIRVAIFGGSSSAGYASPLSFAKIIGNNQFTGKNLEVHNYARNGDPFVGSQAEILKAVMHKYDVLIIYSGHNEIHNQIYSKASKLSKQIIQPNGNVILAGDGPYRGLAKLIQCIKENRDSNQCQKDKNYLLWLNEKSRIIQLVNRINYNFNLSANANTENIIKKFYYTEYFISPQERINIVEDYKKEVKNIAEKLNKKQILILSTVISNDFSPPFADVLVDKSNVEVEVFEALATQAYKSLANDDYKNLYLNSIQLPPSAHKEYLNAMLCLFNNGLSNKITKTCFDIAENARQIDKLPYRIVPEINQFIIQYNEKNVMIIDPLKKLNTISTNLKDYNSFFVDFQHPSAKGHFIIADEILSVLFDDYKSLINNIIIDDCGTIKFTNSEKKQIESNEIYRKKQQLINLKWLENFINKQPYPNLHLDYKRNVQLAIEKCEKN